MRLLQCLLSFIPRRLPVGMSEFEVWSNRIIDQSGEFADRDSMKFALSSQIMHLGAQQSSVPDRFFIRSMRKAAANQVASQFFQDIKLKQQKAAQEAQEKAAQLAQQKLAEATATTESVEQGVTE